MQQCRFEFKYAIVEEQVADIRAALLPYLVPDPFNPEPDRGYSVHSLYLDSPALALRDATVRGIKDRFKLRVRFYDKAPDAPLFCEIKARKNDAIEKERVRLRREALPRVLGERSFREGDLVDSSDRARATIARFCSLLSTLEAQPAAFTSYEREAYVHPEHNGTRLTFDRAVVAYSARSDCDLRAATSRPARLSPVILELKFTDRFPRWMEELARRHRLRRISIPKYVACVDALRDADRRLQFEFHR